VRRKDMRSLGDAIATPNITNNPLIWIIFIAIFIVAEVLVIKNERFRNFFIHNLGMGLMISVIFLISAGQYIEVTEPMAVLLNFIMTVLIHPFVFTGITIYVYWLWRNLIEAFGKKV
jgi:hypothetical protein